MAARLTIDADLAAMRAALGLRPMAEFDPDKSARIYDSLNKGFFDGDPTNAADYRDNLGRVEHRTL